MEISEVSAFAILSHTQNWKLRNLGKILVLENLTDRKSTEGNWIQRLGYGFRKEWNFPRFQFCTIPRNWKPENLGIENLKISEIFLLLRILTVVLTFSKIVISRNRVKACFLWLLVLSLSLLKVSLKFLKWFRRYEDFLRQYKLFSSIFKVFWHFFVTKTLMASA